MEDPARDIGSVIADLCQSTPSKQEATITKYFTQNASFTHPICRTGSFDGSRELIHYIYRWYKILSPRIELEIDSVAFDQDNLVLYVTMHQLFRVQFVPFYKTRVNLTTRLHLTRAVSNVPVAHDSYSDAVKEGAQTNGITRYYITAQEDFYQASELVKFLLPFFNIGHWLVVLFNLWATLLCVLGATVLVPLTWVEERWGGNKRVQEKVKEVVYEHHLQDGGH